MKTMPIANEAHLLNSKLANAGMKPEPEPYVAGFRQVTLEQNTGGTWLVRINGGLPMVATDVEVSLWKALQEARKHGA